VLPVVLGSILVSGHLQPGPETQGGSSEPWPTPNFRIFFTVNLRNISYIYYLFDNFYHNWRAHFFSKVSPASNCFTCDGVITDRRPCGW
jgi:hypothetical protein